MTALSMQCGVYVSVSFLCSNLERSGILKKSKRNAIKHLKLQALYAIKRVHVYGLVEMHGMRVMGGKFRSRVQLEMRRHHHALSSTQQNVLGPHHVAQSGKRVLALSL
eukprot:scpid111808/ scgid35649/ 